MINKISQIPTIKDVRGVYGVYDIIAKVETSGMEELEHIVRSEIRRIPNIRSTVTLLVIDSYSDEPYYDCAN